MNGESRLQRPAFPSFPSFIYMVEAGCSGDQSVKALAPVGAWLSKRFSQENAQFLVDRGVCLAKWNRAHTRILCIQFFGDLAEPVTPRRWLKTGTRYSYREELDGGMAWAHN